MRIRATGALAAVVVTMVFAFPACGVTEQAGGSTNAMEETTTERPTTTEAEVDAEDAAARAKAALLSMEDLPAGFERTPDEPGEDEGGSDLEASCTPEFDNPGETVARASSAAFTSGDLDANDGTYFTADSAVFSSEEIATAVVDRFGDDAFAACVTGSIKAPFAPARATGDLEAVGDVDVGDQAAGLRGALAIRYPDGGMELALDIRIIAIRTHDLVTVLSAVAAGPTLDADLVGDLADIIVERQGG